MAVFPRMEKRAKLPLPYSPERKNRKSHTRHQSDWLVAFYAGNDINLVHSTSDHGLIPVYTQKEKYSDDLFS
jgi:hypothetical protein